MISRNAGAHGLRKFTVAANDCAVAEIRHRTAVHDFFLSRLPFRVYHDQRGASAQEGMCIYWGNMNTAEGLLLGITDVLTWLYSPQVRLNESDLKTLTREELCTR